jgi:hypothetical protein
MINQIDNQKLLVNSFNGSPLSLVLEPVSQRYAYADFLENLGVDVHLAHPMKVKAIASARIKTDPLIYLALVEDDGWKHLM